MTSPAKASVESLVESLQAFIPLCPAGEKYFIPKWQPHCIRVEHFVDILAKGQICRTVLRKQGTKLSDFWTNTVAA